MAYSYPELPLQGGFHGQTGSVYYPNRATNAATGNGMMADQPFRVAHVPTGNSMIVDQPYRMVTGYETANASTGDNMKTDQPFRAGNASTGNSMMNDHPFRMATDYEVCILFSLSSIFFPPHSCLCLLSPLCYSPFHSHLSHLL